MIHCKGTPPIDATGIKTGHTSSTFSDGYASGGHGTGLWGQYANFLWPNLVPRLRQPLVSLRALKAGNTWIISGLDAGIERVKAP